MQKRDLTTILTRKDNKIPNGGIASRLEQD